MTASAPSSSDADLSTSGGIAYRRVGSGPPLVLFHGNSGSWRHWARNIDALAAIRTVLALDLPGFGRSLDVAQDIPTDRYLDLVSDAVLEMCRPESPVDLVGFSFGGQMATAAAIRLGGRAGHLALIAPGGFERHGARDLGLPRRAEAGPSEAEQRDLHRRVLLAIMLADPASADEEAIDIQAKNSARARLKSRHVSFSGRMPAMLAQVRCPVQLIYGERDRMPYPSSAVRIAACREVRPDIRVALVPQAGHWVQYERAATVNRLLLDFISPSPSGEAEPREQPGH